MKHQHNRSVGGLATIAAVGVLALAGDVCAQQAVQWRVEDGGNGHWYLITTRPYGTYDWNVTRGQAHASGGELATLQQPAEWLFVRSLCAQHDFTQFLTGGARQAGGASLWRWLDDSPFSYFAWAAGVPNNGTGESLVLCVGKGQTGPTGTDGWDDWRVIDFSNGYVVEWEADCNSDGIVDYGQILSGQFTDINANGIPDICEVDPCPGDVVQTGTVDAVDLAAVLGAWGTSGGDYPRADINHDGIVAADDLGSLLAGWGACP